MTKQIPAEAFRPDFKAAFLRGVSDWYDGMGLMTLHSLLFSIPVSAVIYLLPAWIGVTEKLSAMRVFSWIAVLWVSAFVIFWINCGAARSLAYFDISEPPPSPYTATVSAVGNVLSLAVIDLLISGALVFDTVFFLSVNHVLAGVLTVICAYALLAWLVGMQWHQSFLASGERGVGAILKKSALLCLRRPLFSVASFFVTMTLGIILIATGIGVFLALSGFCACLNVRFHKELLKEYGLAADPPDAIADRGRPEENGRASK